MKGSGFTRKLFLPMAVVTLLSLFVSCDVINPAEPVPGYVHLDSVHFTTDYPTQGSASSGITDAWVLIDNQYYGTFEMPVTFPVLGEGTHKISIRGGIKVNGMVDNRAAYPKLTTYDTELSVKAGETSVISPTVGYSPAAIFPQIEDFDDGSMSLVNTANSTASLNITTAGDPNAFENNSGVVLLDDNHKIYETASSDTFTLPYNIPVFVELNYKNENEFTVGLYITTSGGNVFQYPLLTLRPTSYWKKVYVNVTELGGTLPSAIAYKLYIHADKATALSTASLYFDNLKVVY